MLNQLPGIANMLRSRLVLTALALVMLACDREPMPPVIDPPDDQPATTPVLLLSPEPAGRFVQNDPTIGCPANANRGYGFRVAFDWADVEGASAYDIIFWQKNARVAAITLRVTTSQHSETRCNAFVIDSNLDDWMWTVKAIARIPIETDSGVRMRDTILSSEERVFGFKPCRLADGRPCNAPPAAAEAIAAFVAAEGLPSVRSTTIIGSAPEEDLTFFITSFGPAQDCPSGCFYSRATGIHYAGRTGWLSVDAYGVPPRSYSYFDIRSSDSYLLDVSLQRRFYVAGQTMNMLYAMDDLRLLMVRDADTPDATLLMLAGRLSIDGFPSLGLDLVDVGRARRNKALLTLLANLADSANYDFAEVRRRAEVAIVELEL